MEIMILTERDSAADSFCFDVLSGLIVAKRPNWRIRRRNGLNLLVDPVVAKPVTEDVLGTREQKVPDVFIVWHSTFYEVAPWIQPLYKAIKKHAPKATTIWIMKSLEGREQMKAVDEPGRQSFVVDYHDPDQCFARYAELIGKKEDELTGEEMMEAVDHTPSRPEALRDLILAIIG